MKPEKSEAWEESDVNMLLVNYVGGAANADLPTSNGSPGSVGHEDGGETSRKDFEPAPKLRPRCRKTTDDTTIVCRMCGKVFTKKAWLKVHMQQNHFTKLLSARDAAAMTSLVVSHKIVQNNKSASEGGFIKGCLVRSAALMCPEKEDAFRSVLLSDRAVADRIRDIAGNLELQLQREADRFNFFSLALDESGGGGGGGGDGAARLLVFVRGITKDFKITEDLVTVRSTTGTAPGSDAFAAVSASLEKLGLRWDRLVGVTTDGSPNLTGASAGLLKRMQDRVSEVNPEVTLVFLHFIVHQNVLCASVLNLNHVIAVVTAAVSFIRARALNHRKFVPLLEQHEADGGGAGAPTSLPWLSLGRVLKRFWALKAEIRELYEEKGKTLPELSDDAWVADLAFAVDVTALMDELGAQLRPRGVFVHDVYSRVKAFMRKTQFLSRQLDRNVLTHVPTLREAGPSADHLRRHASMLGALHAEFSRRFGDFRMVEGEMLRVFSPFTCGVENAPGDVQLELRSLQSDGTLAEHFRSASVLDFYAGLKEENFPRMRRHAQKMLALFGSSYTFEQTFSVMKLNESRYGSSLSDERLSAVLRVSSSDIQPNFDVLVEDYASHRKQQPTGS
ncbi:general transcription factor II-I repeat domain-containing protein 2-like [Brachionichthys hirsutus]|uniref:general transcription factor II-I repeat domain-containing protein 2-like n=1 Tax=Brachionichthys hirsutus TaxID=412623 RepID=UPI0036045001